MIIDAVLPDWPPPDGEPIGEDRARAYIAWIRDHAPPLIAEGRRMMRERYPHAIISTYAANVRQLATRSLSERMNGLNIGGLWCEPIAGTFAFMDIHIRRDGRLELRRGLRMRD